MRFFLIRIEIDPPNQLEFDFMRGGYEVWSRGKDEDEALRKIREYHGKTRSDLQFTMVREVWVKEAHFKE